MRRMHAPTLALLLACSHLLLATAATAEEVATDAGIAADYTPVQTGNGNPLFRPGLCRPLVQPPERILDTWAELDGYRAATADPGATEPANIDVTDPADDVAAEPETGVVTVRPRDGAPPPVQAEAGTMELQGEGVSRLEGDVWLQQGENFLSTEALQFDENSGIVETLAPARFGSRQIIIDAGHARYDTSIGQGRFTDSEFFLLGRNARGEADILERTGESTAKLEGVKYTSCPPEDEDWWLKASSMTLDQEEGIGTARNIRVAFMGVPFFYAPWISFPIDDKRKSGFLFPEFGDSGRTGPWLKLPYYLNLDPRYDATLTPYYMDEHGTMLESEFRYLFNWGAGTLAADYLPNDRQSETERHYYRFAHRSVLPGRWIAGVNYRQVSDEEYFQDFSGSGSATLVSHLSQQAGVQRNTLEWGAGMQVQRYQTVDPTIPESSRPYEKWPEVDYYYTPLPVGDWLWVSLDGNSTNFQRDDRLSGWRHQSVSAFSTDFGTPGLRTTPKLSWWQTEYDMEQPDGSALEISRGLPVASMDTLARLERPLASGGSQSLVPRLFYLYVPFRDQTDIPRFDTRATTDTLASLFRENRFTGPDRVGDENRVSFSLSTALTNPDGREWLTAAVARAWYLDDRQVQLSATAPANTRNASNYYAALEYLPSRSQRVTFDASLNKEEEELDFGSIQYHLQPVYDTVLQLAYRYRRQPSREPLEQVDISFAAPVAARWRIFGRAVYSLEEERSQETLAGFEYENCCWVFRTFNRRLIVNRDGEFDQGLWFQLELKGLSSVGRRIDDFLQRDIYGYGETP